MNCIYEYLQTTHLLSNIAQISLINSRLSFNSCILFSYFYFNLLHQVIDFISFTLLAFDSSLTQFNYLFNTTIAFCFIFASAFILLLLHFSPMISFSHSLHLTSQSFKSFINAVQNTSTFAASISFYPMRILCHRLLYSSC